MISITKENYKEILSNCPVDPDTKIKSRKFIESDELFLMKERWNFDSICGSSVIALTSQLKSKDENIFVETVCRILEIPVPDKYTVRINEEYSFFNYDFES